MTFATLLLIAIGLSADAFAVALGKGLQMKRLSLYGIGALAITFGLFQGLMPILGWAVASTFADQITTIDHWIAFTLLAAIGAKMIWEALHPDDADQGDGSIPISELLLLAVATSIDALAVGISFAFLDVSILGAAALIAVTTFALTAIGVLIGHRAGARFRGPAEIIGGLVLIGIGVKVLLEHTGTRTVHLSEKAVDPPGEARSDLDIFLAYAQAMDFRTRSGTPLLPWRDAGEVFDAWARLTAGRPCDYSGLSHERLRHTDGIQWPVNDDAPDGTARLYANARFSTDTAYCETYGHDLLTGGTVTAEEHRAMAPAGRAFLKACEVVPRPRSRPRHTRCAARQAAR